MSVQFYNTLTKRKEVFEPAQAGKVTMYSCGPTVYQTPSIGNYRAFLLSDLLRRYLEYRGFDVKQVMNITDVGHVTLDADLGADKLEEAARKEGKDPWAIAKHYEEIFKKDLAELGCKPAFAYPRATEHIPEMIEMVKSLIAKGKAYVVNGNVYFDIQKFDDYGKLSNNTLEQLVAGARVEVHPEKKHPADFALWKQDPKHVMQWDSPWGRGFPGWHIECSAMSRKYLGDQFDIHTGGEDLVFPHHECEIAQSEGFSGKKPVVRYWLHNSFLQVDGGKMSKSLGNVILVSDVLKKGFNGRQLRYALIRVNYRIPVNFTWDAMKDAAAALQRIDNFVADLKGMQSRPDAGDIPEGQIAESRKNFELSMDDDLNVSAALAAIFKLVSELNDVSRTPRMNWPGAQAVLKYLEEVNQVLGVFDLTDQVIEKELQALLAAREEARKNKDWKKADLMRGCIEQKGYVVVDTPQGAQLRPRNPK